MSSDELDALRAELDAERERVREFAHFISNLIHELRAAISISDSTLYLMRRQPDSERQSTYQERMEHQLKRMAKLSEDLMLMTPLYLEPARLEFVSTEINAYLKPLIDEHKAIAAEKHITFAFVPETELCFAHIENESFYIAIYKLLDNAVSYTLEGGKVILRTRVQNEQVIISVQDMGIGISENDLPHIFERFYMRRSSNSLEHGGYGLGMAFVRHTIALHSGTITVDSKPGMGSTFTISLPAAITD